MLTNKYLQRNLFSIIINLFFSFTLIIFGPYEIFISNSNDFSFTFKDFWWMLIIVGVLYLIITTLFLSFLPKFLSDILNTFIFAFTLCCYIQAMFLNGEMKVLIGEKISWNASTIIINIAIWFSLFIAIFLLKHFFSKNWKKILQFLAGVLTSMQFIALITLLITTPTLSEEKTGYISTEGMLELSKNQNVIVFILDYFDGRTMESILENNPNILEPLKGFTYFPNATSVHSRTYPSIPYLLTGNICYFDEPAVAYINNAFENSDFLSTLYNNHINLGIYTYSSYIGNTAKSQICNYVSTNLPLKPLTVVKYMLKMVLYRDMPYLVKNRFQYEANDINNNVTSSERLNSAITAIQERNMIPEYKNFDDEWFSDTLTQNRLRLNESNGCFRFYHLGSCHLNISEPEPCGIRSLEIVYNYLDQMRDLKIYDKSTIIITTDHGSSGGGITLDFPQKTAVPLMIVKPSGTSNENLKISNAPVSHSDFIPTILNGFCLRHKENTVFDIPEHSARERYYYYSALYTNEDGEVELREYKINGDARNAENYHFTGNKWDILYSENIVASKKKQDR